ncbi:MAG: hypothetical protein JSU86_04990 [Phycisphaerales bacterium]|nr:MAG: hypothetical protein JSU86_04990 [Phycisphaerales bacterium]
MMAVRQCWLGGCVLLPVVVVGMGCRDTEPPPAHNRDLGSDREPLMPTASVWHDPDIAKGQADWHPFREPEAAPEPTEGETTTGAAPADEGGVETEIRELIDEYNELVAETTVDDVDDLLDYYMEEQHDALRPWLEAAVSLPVKLERIREALEEKLPAEKERIAEAVSKLQDPSGRELNVGSITVVSDQEATAQLPAGSPISTYRFVVVDEEWYIEVPEIQKLAALRPALGLAMATFDGWAQGLDSGQASPQQVLQQVEVAAAAAKPAQDGTGAEEESTTDTAAETGSGDESQETDEQPGGG